MSRHGWRGCVSRTTAAHTTVCCRSFRREALCARDNCFELSGGPNAGTDVGFTITVSPVRGLRATRAARRRCSNTPNPGDGDTVPVMHRADNRVDKVLQRGGRLPTIRAHVPREYFDELCLVHGLRSVRAGD